MARTIKTRYLTHGDAVPTEHREYRCGTEREVKESLLLLEEFIAERVAALGPAPAGYEPAWLENWPPNVVVNDLDGEPRFQVSCRGQARFVRADFVPDEAAAASGDRGRMEAEVARLCAALLPSPEPEPATTG